MRGPWPLAVFLVVVLAAQGLVYAHLARQDGGAPLLVPIRPPLTRPGPGEALLIADDAAPPPAGDNRQTQALAERTDALGAQLADDARRIGAELRFEQLLHIFAQRDRLVRDRYEGRWYVDLADRLDERAKQ